MRRVCWEWDPLAKAAAGWAAPRAGWRPGEGRTGSKGRPVFPERLKAVWLSLGSSRRDHVAVFHSAEHSLRACLPVWWFLDGLGP